MSKLILYGFDTGFTVEHNINNAGSYPPGPPAMDRYTCSKCGGQFEHTQDGVWSLLDPDSAPENTLFKAIKLHRELCG